MKTCHLCHCYLNLIPLINSTRVNFFLKKEKIKLKWKLTVFLSPLTSVSVPTVCARVCLQWQWRHTRLPCHGAVVSVSTALITCFPLHTRGSQRLNYGGQGWKCFRILGLHRQTVFQGTAQTSTTPCRKICTKKENPGRWYNKKTTNRSCPGLWVFSLIFLFSQFPAMVIWLL